MKIGREHDGEGSMVLKHGVLTERKSRKALSLPGGLEHKSLLCFDSRA